MPRLSVAACYLFLALPALVFAEEPDAIYKQGIAKLRKAQADHAALVPATKLLAQAAARLKPREKRQRCSVPVLPKR